MNVNNIFAGILGLILGLTLVYAFWDPLKNFIDIMPTGVQTFAMSIVIIMIILTTVFVPIALLITDDTGK